MSDLTNLQRAAWAEHALLGYSQGKDNSLRLYDEAQSVFGDMLTDLMHYAHAHGFDFDLQYRRAKECFAEELSEEGGSP